MELVGLTSLSLSDSEEDSARTESDDDHKECFVLRCDSSLWYYRYSLLSLVCIVSVAISFNAELTVGLSAAIVNVMDIDILTYEYLEGFGTIPDIITCAVGGYLIDKYLSLGFGLVSMTVTGLIGEGLLCCGVFYSQYWIMVLGMTVVFAAQKLLEIIIFCYQVKWFRDKDLTFALGVSCSARYIGLTLSMSLTNPFYEFLSAFISTPSVRLGVTCLLGPAAAILSVACGIIIVCLDQKKTSSQEMKKTESTAEKFDCKKNLYNFFKHMTLYVWLLTIALGTYYSVIDSYVTFGELFFIRKFKLNPNLAGFANSLLFSINILLLPLLGLLIDVVGYHVWWSLIGVVLALVAHYMLLTFSYSFIPFIAQVTYAISDSLFASSTGPLPAYVVPESLEATTYGIIRSFNNLLFVVTVFAIGYIADTTRYDLLEVFYISLLVVAFVSMFGLLILDTMSVESITNISGRTRRAREATSNDEHLSSFQEKD